MGEATRVTLVLPRRLWEEVKQLAPSGQRSRLVEEALETEVRRRRQQAQMEEVERFQGYLRQKYGLMPSGADEIRQMREERDDDLAGLR